jgi:Phycobilisome degradation protein nblA
MELTMEQEFALMQLNSSTDRLSLEEAKGMVKELMRQSMVKDNFIKSMVREHMEQSMPRLPKLRQK